ncbi:MAG TPA: response regulator [bacterium]|nr:response regulator [bacterium]
MNSKFEAKILYVDDTIENIDIVVDTLGEIYDIIVAKDGKNAIRIAQSEMPDLILLDIVMPGINGYEVCKTLKNTHKTKDIPIIFLTSLSNSVSKKTGFELGAVDYIIKPFEVEELAARVRNHVLVKKASENLFKQNELLELKVAERTFELKEAMKKMEFASLEAILRLSRAAEYRDDDTGNHVFRVGLYSSEIGKFINIGDNNVKKLMLSAPMHDVGKIGIPDSILQKPGKLTDEEWVLMRKHTIMGARILEGSSSDIISLAEMLAQDHHEKWNGKGYPQGKKGEEIPLYCRIVALADVFDALTTERPYKNAFTIEKSFSIIQEEKGAHFDPEIVEAFFAIQDKILEIREKYSDIKKIDSSIFWNFWLT